MHASQMDEDQMIDRYNGAGAVLEVPMPAITQQNTALVEDRAHASMTSSVADLLYERLVYGAAG